MEWLKNNQIKITPPARPKKLTATRFAAIFGLNAWSTPFEAWCEITRTYEKPFEETKYTKAGKVIEPKQIAFMKKSYFMTDIKTPTDIYGADYFKKTFGDFFPDFAVVGGMWDSIRMDKNGKITSVLEFKTTKRAEDWQGEIPEYYALQAALYAYLLKVDDVVMVCSFLEEKDYDKPEAFVPSAKNTITVPFKLSKRYPNFEEDYIVPAYKWWEIHVQGGISPEFDEKADAEILKVLRTNNLNPDTSIDTLVAEAEIIKARLEKNAAEMEADNKRLENINKQIKEYALSQFRDGDTKVTISGKTYAWALSRSESTEIDKDALKKDGILEKYSKSKTTYRLTTSLINKEDK